MFPTTLQTSSDTLQPPLWGLTQLRYQQTYSFLIHSLPSASYAVVIPLTALTVLAPALLTAVAFPQIQVPTAAEVTEGEREVTHHSNKQTQHLIIPELFAEPQIR